VCVCVCACVCDGVLLVGSERQSAVPRCDARRRHHVPGQQKTTHLQLVSHTDRQTDGQTWLDQLLIAIRSLLIVCDHMRSEARLIAITRLIAKLGIIIIYTTRWHDCVLSIKCHCRSADYKHSDGDIGQAGSW